MVALDPGGESTVPGWFRFTVSWQSNSTVAKRLEHFTARHRLHYWLPTRKGRNTVEREFEDLFRCAALDNPRDEPARNFEQGELPPMLAVQLHANGPQPVLIARALHHWQDLSYA